MNCLHKFFTVLFLNVALVASAVPARRDARVYTQPDGTQVTLRLVGDEYHHYYLTDDDLMALPDGNGGFCFATFDAGGNAVCSSVLASDRARRTTSQTAFVTGINQERLHQAVMNRQPRMARMQAVNMASAIAQNGVGLFPGNSFPSKGSTKGLVILVQYQDVKFKVSNPATFFTDMLNKNGFSQYNGTGSARDFFVDASNGVFTPEFDVYGPYTLPNNMSYYGGNDSEGNDSAPEDMIVHACQGLNSQIDFSQYDTNNDGYVDNVYIIYAGQGEASYGSDDSVWPHSWELKSAGKMYSLGRLDGVYINRYACSNELENSTPDGIGTFVHEFSHVMGLPDLYDTKYNNAKTITPNAWSVMDYGPYNNNGRTPPTYSVFERNALGWMDLTVLNPGVGVDVELEHILTSNQGCIIPVPGKSTEFFLLENRQQSGWDKYLPGHGMLIWHIDYNTTQWNNNSPNNSATHQYVDIEEANNNPNSGSTTALKGYAYPGSTGRYTSFTSTSTPAMKSWAGATLNTDITNITETEGKIRFAVCGGAPVTEPDPDPEDPETPEDPIDGAYNLVTSTDAITAGSRIIIAASDYNYAISTTQNDKNRGQSEITKSGNTLQPASDTEIIVLEDAGEGLFNLKVSGGYLYAASSSSNHMRTSATSNANTKAAITVDSDGIATIKFQGSYTNNWIQYNQSSKLFSCYKNAQKSVSIYKLTSAETPQEDAIPQPTANVESAKTISNKPFTLTLTPPQEGDEVHYSMLTDSGTNDLEDAVYTRPIVISEYTCLEAWTVRDSKESEHLNLEFDFVVATPIISPESAENLETMPTVTITSATPNAEIRYTLDGTDPTSSSSLYVDGLIMRGTSATVKAKAFYSTWAPSDIVTATYTVISSSDPTTPTTPTTKAGLYTLVTDADQIAAGDRVIIVAKTSDTAMGATSSNGNNRMPVTIIKGETGIDIAEDSSVESIVIEQATASQYFLHASDGYLYAGSSSKNYLCTDTETNPNAYAEISIAQDGTATITFKGSNTRNLLRYNSSNNIFSCYASGQQPVCLYRLAVPAVTEPDPEDPEDPNTPEDPQSDTKECTVVFADQGWSTGNVYGNNKEVEWRADDGTVFTTIATVKGGSNYPAYYSPELRVYKSSNNVITVNAPNGWKFKQVSVYANSNVVTFDSTDVDVTDGVATYTYAASSEPSVMSFNVNSSSNDKSSKLTKLAFVLANASTFVEGIEVDMEAVPEYYNLQGIRVGNPDHGIYIERRAGSGRLIRL